MTNDHFRCSIITARSMIALLLLVSLANHVSAEDDLARAGCPHLISRHARVSNGNGYVAYYVGGGAHSHQGEYRTCREGTFGVDYMPIVPGFRQGVVLKWWHGQRFQGGSGQYEPNAKVSPLPNLQ
jgi:hypothetical protein